MRDLEEIKKEIEEHYTDSFGFMDHCKRDPGDGPASGNGKLYTAQAIILYERLGVRLPNSYRVFMHKMGLCYLNERHPLIGVGGEKHDNIVGLTALGFMSEYVYKNTRDFPLYRIRYYGAYLPPHVAFLINFQAGKFWGPINTLWFILMLIITPYKKHNDGSANTGERLVGWTMIQPLIDRWPSFGKKIEKWYWKRSNILGCAKIYYGSTPWFELFEHLATKEGY